MNGRAATSCAIGAAAGLLAAGIVACARPDGGSAHELRAYVDTLQAIDSHAHPLAYVVAGAPADSDYDALPLDGLPSWAPPNALLPTNPSVLDAQRALYGHAYGDSASAESKAFLEARARVLRERGANFPIWALDELHIAVMMANRVAMDPSLPVSRFRWVSFADPLILPLDLSGEATRTPDTPPLYALEAKLLRRYLHDLGLSQMPPSLARYQHEVVTATLERQRAAGAVAIKFEAAYLRPLDFALADRKAAATIYARYAHGGVPTRVEYKMLEDYLIRVICREAGRLGMAVQIHSTNGFGGSFDAAGAAPHLLNSLLSDSTLSATTFVIVHGGWPLVDETAVQLARPNVYTDISMMDILADSAALERDLRKWLTSVPTKIMFGTDAFDGGPTDGWEQVGMMASRNARRALGNALVAMWGDHEITGERAREIARMVLRENASKVYGLNFH
jgi:predicted TIM-barrel fold metal-dependent hydrolase